MFHWERTRGGERYNFRGFPNLREAFRSDEDRIEPSAP
jgi:hypothetical protein